MLLNTNYITNDLLKEILNLLDDRSLCSVSETNKFFQTFTFSQRKYLKLDKLISNLNEELIQLKGRLLSLERFINVKDKGLTYCGHFQYQLNPSPYWLNNEGFEIVDLATSLRAKIL